MHRQLLTKLEQGYQEQNLDSGLKIYDEYGPTETTVGVCHSSVYPDKNFTIGKQYNNTTIYILSSSLTPLPIGAIGELYIGGVGLARGYLNRSDLTNEKFIQNPFQTEEEKSDKTYGPKGRNSRIYKTGDLARWLPDGNIEYIGRNDFQVKIRGYRIELGEIESALSSFHGVKQCVVLARDHNSSDGNAKETSTASSNKYLVGYYVSDNKLDEEVIISYLHNKLPDYMVPSILMHLDKLPLTINGKLDRKALPDPEFGSDEDTYVAPRSELEEKLCQIWAEVLGIEANKISIKDDFFRLGGNSILAIKLVNKINAKFTMQLNIAEIFKYNSVQKMIDHIETQKVSDMQKYEKWDI